MVIHPTKSTQGYTRCTLDHTVVLTKQSESVWLVTSLIWPASPSFLPTEIIAGGNLLQCNYHHRQEVGDACQSSYPCSLKWALWQTSKVAEVLQVIHGHTLKPLNVTMSCCHGYHCFLLLHIVTPTHSFTHSNSCTHAWTHAHTHMTHTKYIWMYTRDTQNLPELEKIYFHTYSSHTILYTRSNPIQCHITTPTYIFTHTLSHPSDGSPS